MPVQPQVLFFVEEHPVAISDTAISANAVILIIFCIIFCCKINIFGNKILCLKAAEENINKMQPKKRVLIAPLDWGLGHATRCIPVIRELIAQGFTVLLAAENECKILLEKEFPALEILPLAGYRVTYSKNKHFFFLKMLRQYPKVSTAIRKENAWLKKIVKEKKIDIVISDNRYGLYCTEAYCIFITHQLFIKTGNAFSEKIAQKINYRYINPFNECWVPDIKNKNGLAGELSHPEKMPDLPVKYIGPLSRFKKYEVDPTIEIIAILSGPEPQRSILENILLKQLEFYGEKAVLVRGLPGEHIIPPSKNRIINHLPANELNELILSAKIIIARSGYSTIMDLAILQKKAILVPTPGQTEQEYLAEILAEKKFCVSADQGTIKIKEEIKKLFALQENFANVESDLKEAISSLK